MSKARGAAEQHHATLVVQDEALRLRIAGAEERRTAILGEVKSKAADEVQGAKDRALEHRGKQERAAAAALAAMALFL
ncbi:hypothetical protein T484DRAFT_1895928 [Baffinella frigidus]|nr:hypothetical protein T484DRAFT_1895928 [Cryptophyta sp. CCMP2293]